MDFADASLVKVAERHRLRTVFTIDTLHFKTDRIKRGLQYNAFDLYCMGTTHQDVPAAAADSASREAEGSELPEGGDPEPTDTDGGH